MKNMNLNTGFDVGNESRLVYLDAPSPQAEAQEPKKRTLETGYIEGFNEDRDAEVRAEADSKRMNELGEKAFNQISSAEAKEYYALKNKTSNVASGPADKSYLDMSAGEKMLENPDNPHYQEGTPLAERSGGVTDDTMEARSDAPELTHKEKIEEFTGVVDLKGRVIPEKEDQSSAKDTGETVDAPVSTARSEEEQVETANGRDPLAGIEK